MIKGTLISIAILTIALKGIASASDQGIPPNTDPNAGSVFLDTAGKMLTDWGIGYEYTEGTLSNGRDLHLGSLKLRFPIIGTVIDAPTGAVFSKIENIDGRSSYEWLSMFGDIKIIDKIISLGDITIKNGVISKRNYGEIPLYAFWFSNISASFYYRDGVSDDDYANGFLLVGVDEDINPDTHIIFGELKYFNIKSKLLLRNISGIEMKTVTPKDLHGYGYFEIAYVPEEDRLSLRDLSISIADVGTVTLNAEILGLDEAAIRLWWELRTIQRDDGDKDELARKLLELVKRVKVESIDVQVKDRGIVGRCVAYRSTVTHGSEESIYEDFRIFLYHQFLLWSGENQVGVDALVNAVVEFVRNRSDIRVFAQPASALSIADIITTSMNARVSNLMGIFGVGAEAAPLQAAPSPRAPSPPPTMPG